MCLKTPYVSRADAQREARKQPGCRIYYCPHCRYYHLTSKTKTAVKRTRRGL